VTPEVAEVAARAGRPMKHHRMIPGRSALRADRQMVGQRNRHRRSRRFRKTSNSRMMTSRSKDRDLKTNGTEIKSKLLKR
jgi:hypothetical protein